jgi:hypothetical protein
MSELNFDEIDKTIKDIIFGGKLKDSFPKVPLTFKKVVYNELIRELNKRVNNE